MLVSHEHSSIVAGADYYPFGLAMNGREITDEPYRWGYQGQYAQENDSTGWNEFQLRMYDARFGRWLSPDPYGQYASPYLGMGNAPNMGVDTDGGWNWTTAAIGFGVGALAGYAATGDWEGALVGGLAGGLIGGASFTTDPEFVSAGSQTSWMSVEKSLVLSGFGKSVVASAPNIASSATRALVQAGGESKNFHYFTDEGKAIQFMMNKQSQYQKEVTAMMVTDPSNSNMIVVQPWINNTRTKGRSWRSGVYPGEGYRRMVLKGIEYKIKASIHTHPTTGGYEGPSGSDGDYGVYQATNGLTMFVIGPTEVSKLDPRYPFKKTVWADETGYHTGNRHKIGSTTGLINGSYSLFNFLRK